MLIVSPDDFSHVTVLGRPVEKDEEVDVADDIAAALLEQGWRKPKAAAKPKAAQQADPTPDPDAVTAPTEEQSR